VAQTKYMPEWFYYYGGLADKIHGTVVAVDRQDHFNYILREPVGVCAFITPWNSPLMLTTWKLAPALAAGCTVVIKPSEYTSASLLEFVKLVIAESGLPPGVVNVVTGYGAVVGEPLVTHPKVAKVAFTGGSTTGARVNELAAKTFKKVSLELGGKSPNIVFDDCIVDDAVTGAVSGIFAATGQTCIAGSRLLLQETIHDRLCVQRRLVCSAGDKPAGARVRSPVVWIAGWRETETLKPIDKVSLGGDHKPPGRNNSERECGLENE